MIKGYEKSFERANTFLRAFPADIQKIIIRAQNRAIQSARTAGVKAVRESYITKAGDINKTIKVKKAAGGNLDARFTSRGSSIPLINFQVKPKKPQRMRGGRYLYAKVKRGEGGEIKGAFIADGRKSGKRNIFIRTTNKSYPIRPLYTLSYPQMLENERVLKIMAARAEQMLETRINAETNALLGGYTK